VTATATPFKMSRIGRHGLIYGAGILLSKIVAFIMLPVYTRFLTPADYGVLQLIQMVLEVVSIAAGSRLGAGIFRFYHKAETADERRAVLSTALLVLVTSYCVATAAMFLLAPGIARVALNGAEDVALVRIAGMGLAFEGLLLVPLAYLRVRDRSMFYVTLMSGKLLLQVTLNIVFVVYHGLGAKGVLLSTLVANVLTGSGLTVYLVRDIGLRFSGPAARQLLRFGLPFVVTQVATFILTFGDRFFLKRVSDASTVGLYALAYQFGFLLAMLSEVPFSMVWEPARFEIAKRPDRDELYARGFVYFNVILLTIAVCIALFVGDLLAVMAAPAFHSARDLVPIILIAYILQSWTLMHDIGIQVRERTEFITLATWAGAIVALVGYALLIPRFLGLGAAIATVISFAVRECAVYRVSQRLWPVQYRWGPVLRATLLAGMAGVIGVLLPRPNLWASLLMRLLVLAAYVGGLWYVGVLSADDRRAVKRFIRSHRHTLFAITERTST
jgi:O-antigen/teichoic acid export membrane protein